MAYPCLPHRLADLKPGDHLCCLYESEEEHRAVLIPFVRQGLAQGGQVLCIVDHTPKQNGAKTPAAATILDYLRDDGLDVEPYLSQGQLLVLTRDAFCTSRDVLAPDKLIALLRTKTEQALAEGYLALRVVGEMSWAARGGETSAPLIECETKLDRFVTDGQCLVLCQYDRRRSAPQVLLDVLCTHPIAVVGATVYDNPRYITPAELLDSDLQSAKLAQWIKNLAAHEQAEAEIQAGARRLLTVIETVGEGITLSDGSGHFEIFNSKMEEITGYSRQEANGCEDFLAFLYPDPTEHREALHGIQRIVEQGGYRDVETTIRAKDGSRKTLLVSTSTLRYQDCDWLLSAYRDITGRKQAEQALAVRARQQAALFQLSADLAASLDEDDVCHTVVRGLHDTLGYDSVALLLVDESTGARELRASIGWPDRQSRWHIPPGQGLSECPMLDGQLHYTPDVTHDPRYVAGPGFASGAEVDVPVRVGDRVLGVLVIESKQPHAFDEDDFGVLTAAANQTASAIENARLFEETQKRAEQMTALRQINMALTSTLERDQILEMVLDQLKTIFDYDAASIQALSGPHFVKVAAVRPSSHDEELKQGFDASQNPLFYEMKEERKAVIIDDVRLDDRWQKIGDWEPVRSWVGVPLFARDDFLGFLNVEKDISGFYKDTDVQLLLDFAQGAALAIENARLFGAVQQELIERVRTEQELQQAKDELEKQNTRLETLYHVGQVVNSTLQPDVILDRLTDEAMRVTRATHGQVLVVREEQGYFERRSQRGFSPAEVERAHTIPLPLDQGINGRAYATRQPVCVDDVRAEPSYFPLIPATRTELAVPIVRGEEVLGNLDLQSPEVGAFCDVDLDYLKALADQVAIALENARVFRTVEQGKRDWETTFDAMQDAVALVNRNQRILRVNRAFVDMVCRAYPQVVGQRYYTVLSEQSCPQTDCPLAQTMESGQPARCVHEYGGRVYEVQTTPVWARDTGELDYVARMVYVMRDITERKWAEEVLRRTERLTAMGRLAAALAHEINNPLQAIRSNLELVLDFGLEPDEREQYLYICRQEIERLIEIAQRVLSFARPARDTRRPAFIAHLTRWTLALVGKQLQNAHIQVTTDFPPDLPPVLVASDQIVQVLLNCMVNAAEVMPDGGLVHVTAREQGAMIELTLTNNGPPVPEEHIEHIFDPFFTTKPDGTGLGLSVSYSIVQGHGGTIRVENLKGERGVRFSITLPIARPAKAQEAVV